VFFNKDELSKFDFISISEFFLALFLILLSILFSLLALPNILKRFLPVLFESYYFAVVFFFIGTLLSFYVIYFFCCKRKSKTLQEGLFITLVSRKTMIVSLLIGVIMPLSTIPIIFKFAPSEFYAVDLIKKEGGMFFLFAGALIAPLFEEVFYRGFVFPFTQSKLNSFWAIIITSIFFGLSHIMNISGAYVLLSLFISYGFVLTLIRYFTRSLIPSITTHFIHNLVLIVSFLSFHSF